MPYIFHNIGPVRGHTRTQAIREHTKLFGLWKYSTAWVSDICRAGQFSTPGSTPGSG